MDLRSEFETAWKGGESHDALLELVHGHMARGMSAQDAYHMLHKLWQECGFDDADEPCSRQDQLEYVLEKLWYECPIAK